jgi:hypothetical protein
LVTVICASGQAAAADETFLQRSNLCVTEGSLAGVGPEMSVLVPKMRAYVTRKTTEAVELQFVYSGATDRQVPLASGASRVQFGLKLRAADACNLVYVMWRVEPVSKLVVSIKKNAGQHSSAACGNHGYRDVPAELTAGLPQMRTGDRHRLRAEIRDDALSVFVDERVVWRGRLPADAAQFKGPVGLRTDNVKLTFEVGVNLLAEEESEPGKQCVSSDE